MSDHFNRPYGGELVDLIVSPERASNLQAEARYWPSWDLSARQLCDVELLLNGAFSPLRGFLSRGDYESVCSRMRLANGLIWPIPVMLDVSDEFAQSLSPGIAIGPAVVVRWTLPEVPHRKVPRTQVEKEVRRLLQSASGVEQDIFSRYLDVHSEVVMRAEIFLHLLRKVMRVDDDFLNAE